MGQVGLRFLSGLFLRLMTLSLSFLKAVTLIIGKTKFNTLGYQATPAGNSEEASGRIQIFTETGGATGTIGRKSGRS